MTIPDLLRQAARRYGSAPALIAEGRRATTYESLYQLVRECRYALFAAGLAPGQRMALAMPAGAEAITLNLVAMSAGIALPMNPGLPLEAVVAQLQALGPSIVVASETLPAFREAAARLNLPFVGIKTLNSLPAGQFVVAGGRPVYTRRDPGVSPPFLPFSTAAVLQTSGSTGEPKRVPLTHGNLLAGAAAIERAMELTEGDRFLNVTPHFRVVGLGLVLAALKAGNAIYCPPGFLRAQFFDWAAAFQPTWFWAAPAMLKELLPLAQVRGALPCGGALRAIRTGSAALSADWLTPLEAAFGAPVVENYGMTEASPQITCNPLDPALRRPGSAGQAAGPEILVLTSHGTRAAPGVEGDILIRGANVTSGYEGATPGITETGDAFWDGLGHRWFRTGDVGRLDSDGFLYLSGRKAEMINRGGEKVFPREVEEVLERHPAVEQAVVFAVPHATLGEEVGAAVVLSPGEEVSEADLRAFTRAQVAGYQTPFRIAFVPAIHVGPGGKVERSKMAAHLGMEIAAADSLQPAAYAAPATALEKELAVLWRGILRRQRIGLDDNFFLLGGDSLAVATLSTAIQDNYGAMRRLPDRADFFEYPTIRAQALIIESAQRGKSAFPTSVASGFDAAPDLLPLNPRSRRRDDAPPLFLAPFASSSPAYLKKFASQLMAQQRCFGIDISSAATSSTLEEMAALLVSSVEAAYPEGPLYLGGHCFGGVLAYEMAQQLAAKGRTPAALFLFDVPTPGYPHLWRERALFARALLRHATDPSHYRLYLGAAWRHLRKLNAARLEAVGLPASDDASIRLMRLYQPKPYQGETVVFVARNHIQTNSPLDRRLGWTKLIRPVPEVIHVDSAHLDLFDEPHVHELAAVCLQRLPAREITTVLALAASDSAAPGTA